MDNYPDHLSPEFDDTGGVVTPFEEWWPRVREAFPHVPAEVARDWLHRHWRYSTYDWLASADYRFTRVEWASTDLRSIRINWNNFADQPEDVIDQGRYLAERHRIVYGNDLAEYMIENGTWPVPPVILDNRDGHVHKRYELPTTYVLVEGHRRFQIGSYLASTGRMVPQVNFWMMTRALA